MPYCTVHGLAFLPVHDIIAWWSELKAILQSQYSVLPASFMTYFEATWILNSRYPLAMWSCYAGTSCEMIRRECSNNALNVAAACSSPTICNVLRSFSSE